MPPHPEGRGLQSPLFLGLQNLLILIVFRNFIPDISKMMNNKKAWLRIVEASIAVLMVASALVILVLRLPDKPDIDLQVHETQRLILKQISLNDSLRTEILQGGTLTETEKFINSIAPSSWNFEVKSCEISDSCAMAASVSDKDIYADQILISATLQQYSPKKLKFFVWIEG